MCVSLRSETAYVFLFACYVSALFFRLGALVGLALGLRLHIALARKPLLRESCLSPILFNSSGSTQDWPKLCKLSSHVLILLEGEMANDKDYLRCLRQNAVTIPRAHRE
jgi:hypothetical protein